MAGRHDNNDDDDVTSWYKIVPSNKIELSVADTWCQEKFGHANYFRFGGGFWFSNKEDVAMFNLCWSS